MGIESGLGGPATEAAKQHEAQTEREAILTKRIQQIGDKRKMHPYLDSLSDDEIRIQAEREVENPLFPSSKDVVSTGGLTPEAKNRFEAVAEKVDQLQLIQALVDSENRGNPADEEVFRIVTNALNHRYQEFRNDLPALKEQVDEYIDLIHAMEDRADDRDETYKRLAELVPDIEQELSKEARIRNKVKEMRKTEGLQNLEEWEREELEFDLRERAKKEVEEEIIEEGY